MSDYDRVQVSGQKDARKCSAVQLVTVTLHPHPSASRRSNNRGGVVEEPGGKECRVHSMEIHEKRTEQGSSQGEADEAEAQQGKIEAHQGGADNAEAH